MYVVRLEVSTILGLNRWIIYNLINLYDVESVNKGWDAVSIDFSPSSIVNLMHLL